MARVSMRRGYQPFDTPRVNRLDVAPNAVRPRQRSCCQDTVKRCLQVAGRSAKRRKHGQDGIEKVLAGVTTIEEVRANS